MIEVLVLLACGVAPIWLGKKYVQAKSSHHSLYNDKVLRKLPYLVKNKLWEEETTKINKVIKLRNEFANYEGYAMLKRDIEEMNDVLSRIEKEPKIVKYKYILNIKILLRKLYKSVSNTEY